MVFSLWIVDEFGNIVEYIPEYMRNTLTSEGKITVWAGMKHAGKNSMVMSPEQSSSYSDYSSSYPDYSSLEAKKLDQQINRILHQPDQPKKQYLLVNIPEGDHVK